MSIRVVCPNGHALHVKDNFAGKSGLCPKCKARVEVPLPQGELSEDSIMNILGPRTAPPDDRPSADPDAEAVDASPEVGLAAPPQKSCHKCNRVISAGLHICPFCHTYIAELSDF